jgi:putative ABC transport system permease protein
MLVVLLAAGKGLRNGIEYQFRDDAVNSIWMWPGNTSIPFGGHPIGRKIQFTNADYDAIKALPGVEHITGRVYLWDEGIVKRGDKKSAFDIRSVHPGHRFLEKTLMIRGRYIDEIDLAERRKVAVIGDEVRDFLFTAGEEPIGQWVTIAGLEYQVVGVFQDEGGQGERRKIFIPISTAQMAYGGAQGGTTRINQIMLTVGSADIVASKKLEKRILELLAERHHFSPDDKRALRINNNLEEYAEVAMIFTILELFVWVVGGLTILAGIVGVSNIMLIAVRERTREIGIRKSFGATPGSILRMITQEALVLTAVSGYLGLASGVALVELVASLLPPIDIFRDPQVDMSFAITATVLLIVTGTLAGFFPAWRAARINPIEALRDE